MVTPLTIDDQELPQAGVRTNGSGARLKHSDALIELASEASLFHSPDGIGYADIRISGHRQTWQISSKGFRRWLVRRFHKATGEALGSESLRSALNVIEATAQFDAPERNVAVRVAEFNGLIYVDLADAAWRAVEIDVTGWRVVDEPPVRFRRTAGMKPLPEPMPGGSIEALRPFLNVASDADFVLVVAWLLACLRGSGPYPLIALSGEQGSAKSTFSAIMRALIDPNTAPLRALPRDNRDLFIAASNGFVLAFDNASAVPAGLADTFCRLASGGGFAVRQLYTDSDEVLFHASRPILLNGIDDVVIRPDLADRAIFLTLMPIAEDRRSPEQELWSSFEAERPRIFGALLDAAVVGLKRLPHTRLERPPRMADFAMWATACETALWPVGTFEIAYNNNRNGAVEDVLDADPVAGAVRIWMTERAEWTGTATDLLAALAHDNAAKSKTWPDTPRVLAGRLRRAATFLRKIGVAIEFGREGKARTRTIRIANVSEPLPVPENIRERPSASSTSSGTIERGSLAEGPADTAAPTVGNQADGRSSERSAIVRKPALESGPADDADGADAKQPGSVPQETGTGGWRARL